MRSAAREEIISVCCFNSLAIKTAAQILSANRDEDRDDLREKTATEDKR
jgi:hypothetical protein